MVSTRSKRRCISEEARDDGEDARLLNPEEAETALEEAEATRCRKIKKKKFEAFKKNHPPLELILIPEITVQIMSYFDDCRDVYNFAKCSTSIRAAVTSEIVIRSAVFAGGKARQAISNVMNLVREKAIHTPSTFRYESAVIEYLLSAINIVFATHLLTLASPVFLCVLSSCA